MSGIRFESSEDSLEILNPFKQFEREIQRLQIRRDPLLGSISVYNGALKGKAKVFFGDIDWPLVERLAEQTAAQCVFCPKNLARTAQYPRELIPGGRIRVEEAMLFPNLFALAKHHAVVAVSEAHFLKLSELRSPLIANAFRAVHRFINTVYQSDAGACYATVNASYLFPAGASLMHPHFQVLVTADPYTYHARLVDVCRDYSARYGTPYHRDLVEEERRIDTRYIAQTGHWHWIAAYAPMGSNEVVAVHETATDVGQLAETDLEDLADGLSRVLRLYERLGFLSFNWSLFSVRAPSNAGFNCLLRVINRPNPYPNYRNDDYFLQKLLQTDIIVTLPEEFAQEARNHFQGYVPEVCAGDRAQ